MLSYPLDPNHARILLASFNLGCPSEIIDILSLLNAGTVWIDRSSDRESASVARAKHFNRDGDHLTALNVFRAYLTLRQQEQKSTNLVRWTKENHVNGKTLAAAVKIRDQLKELVHRQEKDATVSCGGDTSVVVRALLQGLFMNTAVVQADGTYRQTAGSLVSYSPSSVQGLIWLT